MDGRVPVVAGIGCNNPLEVIEQIQLFDLRKVSAILSVAPYYNKPQQQGLLGHYRMIAHASPLPLILYNVPGRTGVNIAAETTLELARTEPKIVAVKEASGILPQIMRIMQDKPEDFSVISGDDRVPVRYAITPPYPIAYPDCRPRSLKVSLTASRTHFRTFL